MLPGNQSIAKTATIAPLMHFHVKREKITKEGCMKNSLLVQHYGIRGGSATFVFTFICFCIVISVFISVSIFLFISFTFYTESTFFIFTYLRILISVFISVSIFLFIALRLRCVMPYASHIGFKFLFFSFIIWHINLRFHLVFILTFL